MIWLLWRMVLGGREGEGGPFSCLLDPIAFLPTRVSILCHLCTIHPRHIPPIRSAFPTRPQSVPSRFGYLRHASPSIVLPLLRLPENTTIQLRQVLYPISELSRPASRNPKFARNNTQLWR